MMMMMMDLNWHMGSLRLGLKWSSDGGGGSCQPHIDHHPRDHHHPLDDHHEDYTEIDHHHADANDNDKVSDGDER